MLAIGKMRQEAYSRILNIFGDKQMVNAWMADYLTLNEVGGVAWQVATDVDWSRVDRQNIQVLTLLAALEENVSENVDEYAEYQADFAILNTKLNVLMSLVSDLVLQNQGQAVDMPFQLNERRITWQAVNLPQMGQKVQLEVYLDQSPKPLQLSGEVGALEGGHVLVDIQQGSDVFFDLLAKLIFRRHRREVALAKQS
ncbi:MAG: hypothetical protein HOM11_06600 [Methylococcales bacterium]|jgi:hypothetical protein|nr:hypothetical protein [Methylococcales bacterium]MBT7442722.1 hypothetical protein [Methylococcales bacterium]